MSISTYGSLLGAIGAVMIVDYWIVRKRQLSLADLYKHDGIYAYSGGFLTFTVSAVVYLGLSMIGGSAAEPAREPEAT
jgi:cytosine/uracil/thiamine/allantoin permease